MSQYYKPNRKPEWNYGGNKWRLSRSKIDLFLECPRCFYLDNKLGTARPPGYPFSLNSAVDKLLKKEFDAHRAKKIPHPLMTQYGIDAVPFQHAKMDIWRENFKGVDFFYKLCDFSVSGAIDDAWVNPKGELHVVDYKATSKDGEVTLDAEWQEGYKILLVEFRPEDIACIPHGTDGKFRVHRCTVVREMDLKELGVTQ